jgi:hypothetical protein
VRPGQLVGPVGREHQDRFALQRTGDAGEGVEGGGVGEVQVLEKDDGRPALRDRTQGVDDVALRIVVRGLGRCAGRRGPQRRGHQGVGASAGRTGRGQPVPVPADQHVGHEPGLPDPGLATDQDETAAARTAPVERGDQPRPLGPPTDQR